MSVKKFFSNALIKAIKFYQYYISPLHRPSCRFYPTCSNYSIEAIKKFGPFQGTIMSVYRVLRCGPWSAGGYDPPDKPIFHLKRSNKNGR